MAKYNGIEVYNGPSVLDGSPIIAVLIFKSMNAKTGDMMQLHIMRSDLPPLEASKRKLESILPILLNMISALHRVKSGSVLTAIRRRFRIQCLKSSRIRRLGSLATLTS